MNNYAKELQLKFDEINALDTASLVKEDADTVCDEVLETLIDAYLLGISHVSQMLDTSIDAELDEMEDIILLKIDGKTFEDRVRDHVTGDDPSGLKTLVDSEYHRVYCGSAESGANRIERRDNLPTKPLTGVQKTWCTMLDDRVRETHNFLEDVSVPLNEEFYTIDGDHAYAPGGFMDASNNVNCRCFLLYHR